jgi:2-haloacid dehalogenase
MLDFSQFEWLSFDCYGTLIDWESGILGYLQPLLEKKGRFASDEEVLNLYSQLEPRNETPPYRSYREVLSAVVRDFGREFRFPVTPGDAGGLADSLAQWEPFPDTVPSLQRLKSRYKLAILSNIDDDLFARSAPKLGVPFDCVVTSQKIRSYKPTFVNFQELMRGMEFPRERHVHVAESLYHDVAPARHLGIAAVWVNRRQGNAASASKLARVSPNLEVRDLHELAELAVPPSSGAVGTTD